MKHITAIRKAVCTIANNLRKVGYTLSQAFRIAWHRARETKFRAVGVTAENRQERLEYLKSFDPEDLQIRLQREHGNQYDENAIQIIDTKTLNLLPPVLSDSTNVLISEGK